MHVLTLRLVVDSYSGMARAHPYFCLIARTVHEDRVPRVGQLHSLPEKKKWRRGSAVEAS